MRKDIALLDEIGEFEDGLVPTEVGLEVKSPFAIAMLIGIGIGIIALSWFAYNKFLKQRR